MKWRSELTNQVETIQLKTTVHIGPGAINKMEMIAKEFKDDGQDKVLVVTDGFAYKKSGAWDAVEPILKANDIEYLVYEGARSNPDVEMVDEGAKLGRDFGAKAVIGIGGGSSIDCSKAISVMIVHPDNDSTELMLRKFVPTGALPIVAINLTHGTSTEANSYAVISVPELGIKPGFGAEFTYPKYAIDDAELMSTLPPKQTIYTSIDAVSHAIEAATARNASPLAIAYAADAIEHVAKSLPKVIADPKDLKNRHYLAYAAMIAGQAFCASGLHLGHFIEHPLSSVNTKLAHGLGLGVILPATTAWGYQYRPQVSAHILKPIIPDLKGEASELERVKEGIETWLNSMGLTEKMGDVGFEADDVPMLTEKVEQWIGALGAYGDSVLPGTVNSDDIRSILEQSFI